MKGRVEKFSKYFSLIGITTVALLLVLKLALYNIGYVYRVWFSLSICTLMIISLIALYVFVNVKVQQKGQNDYNVVISALTSLPLVIVVAIIFVYARALPRESIIEDKGRKKVVISTTFKVEEYDFVNFIVSKKND